jgi:hypothetical protein
MSTNSKIKLNMDSLKARREWKRHKVKDGHNVYRILPPFGEASNGYPYKKWQIIWGLFDPESGRARPFASSATTEKKCPVYEYVQELKKHAEVLKSKLQSAGESEEAIKERMSTLNKLISDISPKTVYIYNAADKAGDVGLLELKSTAHKQIKAEMTQYIQDYNMDPTSLSTEDSDSGAWFDVVRTGEFRDTEYNVKRLQTKVKGASGKLVYEDDRTPLPDSVVENYENLAYDLTSVYQVKTYDELSEILAANMASIVEACPDADLTGETVAPVAVAPPKATPKTIATAGKKPVTVRLDDEDEEEPQAPVRSSGGKSVAAAGLDQDFLAEADALLNS